MWVNVKMFISGEGCNLGILCETPRGIRELIQDYSKKKKKKEEINFYIHTKKKRRKS